MGSLVLFPFPFQFFPLQQVDQIVGIDGEWRFAACNLGVERWVASCRSLCTCVRLYWRSVQCVIIPNTLHRMALLQLATLEAVFLLDVLLLGRTVSEGILRKFLSDLLATDRVMKIGYGIDGDLRMLAKTWHFAVDIIGTPKKILDLQLFVPTVSNTAHNLSSMCCVM